MARKTPISITIDSELLERIDRYASASDESRSTVIERMCRNDIAEQEEFLGDMESPTMRMLYKAVASKPVLEMMLSVMEGESKTTPSVQRSR